MKRAVFNYSVLILILGMTGLGLSISYAEKNDKQVNYSLNELVEDTPFDKMMKVLTHKRCVNCHPAGESPRQGEDSHIHLFGVVRGEDNQGAAALRCNSCHQAENNNLSGVPGAPEWSLAPLSMQWEGLSRVEIARSMLDKSKNGGRSVDDIMHHLTEHELVLWAWEPGVGVDGKPRELPPVGKEEYIKAVKDWVAAGAPIPAE